MNELDQRIANRLRHRDWLTASADERSDWRWCSIMHCDARALGMTVAQCVAHNYRVARDHDVLMGRGAAY